MSGPMKRIPGALERERNESPLPRPIVWLADWAAWLFVEGEELALALLAGIRAGLWLAFVILGFVAAFFGIGVVLYLAGLWLVSRFAV